MRWRIPLVLSLIAFVAVSCDQQLVSPEVDQVASEATFDFMNNPDGGSLIIDRWESHWRACWQDFDNGLFVCHVTTTPGGGEPAACSFPGHGRPQSEFDGGRNRPRTQPSASDALNQTRSGMSSSRFQRAPAVR